jgi:membrane fusion protein, multidrug efflux system
MVRCPKLASAFFLGLLLLTSTACRFDAQAGEAKSEKDKEEDTAVPVQVTTLARGPIEAVLRFSTNLEAEAQVQVLAEAARQVRQLLVEEGAEVRKGQVLLRLQDDEQRTAVAKVESELAKVQREYARQQRLYDQGFLSEEDFSNATYQIEQLGLSLDEAKRELSYTEVRAPISGTVTGRHVNLGDHVSPNQHLFDIVDFDSIVARVFVPEKELPRLRRGQETRLSAPSLGEQVHLGRIERISPVVDPQSGTVKVTVAIPGRHELRPGLYVDVELVTDVHEDALLVPKRALVYDQDQIFVYRLQGLTVERLAVRPLLEDKETIEPQPAETGEGLEPGDRLVVAGQAGLKDGAEVRLVGPGSQPAEALAEVP